MNVKSRETETSDSESRNSGVAPESLHSAVKRLLDENIVGKLLKRETVGSKMCDFITEESIYELSGVTPDFSQLTESCSGEITTPKKFSAILQSWNSGGKSCQPLNAVVNCNRSAGPHPSRAYLERY